VDLPVFPDFTEANVVPPPLASDPDRPITEPTGKGSSASSESSNAPVVSYQDLRKNRHSPAKSAH
jgi:hypothetical protein